MSMRTAMVTPSLGFECFAATLALSERQTRKLWQALCACGESDSRAFLYTRERLGLVVSARQQHQVARQWMLTCGRPTHIVKLLERLVTRKLCSRSEANVIQESILHNRGTAC